MDPLGQDEFTAFYHETATALRGYIRRVSGEGEAADDLLQETYLRFLRAKPAAEDRAAMKAYLYKTATAAIYDRWRKRRRERLWSLAFRFHEQATPAAGTGDVTRCFQRLKPRERALLWLAYVEGYAHNEIAGTLDLNEKSIKVLLFRARRSLERILRQNGLSEVQP
jgi:RNA polymerase sigma-70 factor (ECF subfamily)